MKHFFAMKHFLHMKLKKFCNSFNFNMASSERTRDVLNDYSTQKFVLLEKNTNLTVKVRFLRLAICSLR